MLLVLGVLIVVALVWYIASRSGEPAHTPEEDEQALLSLCLGDREQAERLMVLEADKAPGITRAEAIRRALRSLRRDLK